MMAPRIEQDQVKFLRPLPVVDPNRHVGELAPYQARTTEGGRQDAGFAPVLRRTAEGPQMPQAAGQALALPAPVPPARPLLNRQIAAAGPETAGQVAIRERAAGQTVRPEAVPQRLVELLNEARGRAVVVGNARGEAGVLAAVNQNEPAAPVRTAPAGLAPVGQNTPPAEVRFARQAETAAPAATQDRAGEPQRPGVLRANALTEDMRRLVATRALEEAARRQTATRLDTPPLRTLIDTAV
jgi:hypothetical protein